MIKKFQIAIEKNELLDFALGKGPYFVGAIHLTDGHHSNSLSWSGFIIPLIEEKGLDYVNHYIEKMFESIIHSNLKNEIKIEILLNHLLNYYNRSADGSIAARKLTGLNHVMNKMFDEYLDEFRKINDLKNELSVLAEIKKIKANGGLQID